MFDLSHVIQQGLMKKLKKNASLSQIKPKMARGKSKNDKNKEK
jgi:hypothetical protein